MRRMKVYDCFWEMRQRKLRRMNDRFGYKYDLMSVLEKEEYARFKEERDKHGVKVYRMIQERTKQDNLKKTISNNAFRTYADKCLQTKVPH